MNYSSSELVCQWRKWLWKYEMSEILTTFWSNLQWWRGNKLLSTVLQFRIESKSLRLRLSFTSSTAQYCHSSVHRFYAVAVSTGKCGMHHCGDRDMLLVTENQFIPTNTGLDDLRVEFQQWLGYIFTSRLSRTQNAQWFFRGLMISLDRPRNHLSMVCPIPMGVQRCPAHWYTVSSSSKDEEAWNFLMGHYSA